MIIFTGIPDNLKTYFFTSCFTFLFIISNGQVKITLVDTSSSAIYKLAQTIAGKGVKISNVTYKAAVENDKLISIGTFKDRKKMIGLSEGVFFSTGRVKDAEGPNNSPYTNTPLGLPDDQDLKNYLLSISNLTDHHDASFIAFDFIPITDTIKLNFVLASEHYNNISQDAQDIFVVLLSAPGMSNYKNIATLSGINQFISPYNIHCGEPIDWTLPPPSISGTNCALYRFNPKDSPSTQFNGYTIPITIKAKVNICQSIRIKLIIGDFGDDNSGIFIAPGELGSQSVSATRTIKNDTVSICSNEPMPVFSAGSKPSTVYQWYRNDTFTGIITQTITANSVGEYKVVSTISGGCTWTDSLWLRIGNPFTLTSPGVMRCTPDSVTITTTASIADNYFYEWLDDFQYLTRTYQKVKPESTSSYNVNVTNAGGCTITDTVIANVNPVLFSINIQAYDSVVCYGKLTTLKANLVTTPSNMTGIDPYTISWINKTNAIGTGDTLKITPTITGIYSSILLSNNQCRLEDSTQVSVIIPAIKVSGDTSICKGKSTLLSVSGTNTYLWHPPSSLNNITLPGPLSSPLTTTVYTVTGFTQLPYQCATSKQVKVIIFPSFSIIKSNDSTICKGSAIKISASRAKIIWNTNIIFPADSIFYPAQNTTYAFTAENVNKCIVKDSIKIKVNPVPIVKISKPKNICKGDSVILKASGVNTYFWKDKENFSSFLSTPTVKPTKTTTYFVDGYNNLNCKSTDSVALKVFEITLTGFISASRDTVCREEQLYASLSGPNGFSYLWMPINKISKSITATNPGNYYLTLTDINNCQASDSILIKKVCRPSDTILQQPPFIPESFKIPNVITPNGDDLNDSFEISELEKGSSLIIFNRWGKSVFESENYHNEWVGENQTDGLYYYYLHTGISKKVFRGWLHLIR